MHVIIAYDISKNKTRNRLFKLLKQMGLNTQLSVFECELDYNQLMRFKNRVESILDSDTDSVLLYPLCNHCARGVTVLGQGIKVVHTDWSII